MSTRYGIGLALEPGFTARVYRARQLICGQYASWAAEMHMVFLPLRLYLECLDTTVELLDSGLAEIAAQSKQDTAQFPLSHSGVGSHFGDRGDIFLEFGGPKDSPPLNSLFRSMAGLLEDNQVTGNPPTSDPFPDFSDESLRLKLPLMQHAKLLAPVFEDAVEFADAVVADLQIPKATRAWRLLLLRFESDAAGEYWEGGSWAPDLKWQLLASYSL